MQTLYAGELSKKQKDSLQIMEQMYSQSLQESALSRLELLLSTLADARLMNRALRKYPRDRIFAYQLYLDQVQLRALLEQDIAESFERKAYLRQVPYWRYTQEDRTKVTKYDVVVPAT